MFLGRSRVVSLRGGCGEDQSRRSCERWRRVAAQSLQKDLAWVTVSFGRRSLKEEEEKEGSGFMG